jgi:ribonuclease P protein component
MFSQAIRLHRKKDIERVFKLGEGFYGQGVHLKVMKNKSKHNRFCIIISAKASKKATERNKIRRKIKAVILDLNPVLKQGYDFLFIVKKDFVYKDFLTIKSSFFNYFKKLKIC